MKNISGVVIFLVISSCGVKTTEGDLANVADSTSTILTVAGFDENNYDSFIELSNYQADNKPDPPDVQVIDSTSVIIINPTEAQVAEMEEKYGEDFYTIADDNSFYQYEAAARLDSLGIKTISAEKDFLQLQGKSEKWILDIRKEGAPEWNMIFFHTGKKPEIVPSIDATHEKIKEYFGNLN